MAHRFASSVWRMSHLLLRRRRRKGEEEEEEEEEEEKKEERASAARGSRNGCTLDTRRETESTF